MAWWHRGDVEMSRLRHPIEDAKRGDREGSGGGRGAYRYSCGILLKPNDTSCGKVLIRPMST